MMYWDIYNTNERQTIYKRKKIKSKFFKITKKYNVKNVYKKIKIEYIGIIIVHHK